MPNARIRGGSNSERIEIDMDQSMMDMLKRETFGTRLARIILLMLCSITAAHAQVVFTEDFEAESIDDIAARWDDVRFREYMSLSEDVPPGSPGRRSLMMVAEIGRNTGGHLYKMFPHGFDSLYARFSVKFGSTHHPVHHFVHMGGYNPPTRWPQGGAGERPSGSERFTTGIEPHGARWEWDFYTYWMHMRGNPVPGKYWGNDFNPDPPAAVARGRWMTVEFMMKCNNPVSSFSGEQAFWIDGRKVLHLREGMPRGYWVWDSFHHHPDSSGFEGFQWRDDPALRVNFFWLLYYMTQGPGGQRDTVWFDDIRIATQHSATTTGIASPSLLPGSDDVQTHPNPFRGTLSIRLPGSTAGPSRITMHDRLGRIVHTWQEQPSGREGMVLRWTPGNLPAGVYMLRLQSEAGVVVRNVLYLR